MTPFDFDAPLDRRGSDSRKWHRYAKGVLPMWVADMDFAVAPAIVQALGERLGHAVFGYAAADAALRDAVVAHCEARYDWRIEPGDIVFLPGVEPGFNMALKALTRPGDAVVVNTPVYKPILDAPAHWGLERLELPLVAPPDSDAGWEGASFEPALRDSLLDRARVLLLCNPHNPVGRVFRRDELAELAQACIARDVWIVSDEIHADLLLDDVRHQPIAAIDPAVAKRTITLMAASKAWNIAGLKTAFAIIPNRPLRERFEAARLGMVDSVNLFGLVATRAALEHGQAWRHALIDYLRANRDHLAEAIGTRLPGMRMRRPEATFLAWLDCSALQLPTDPQTFFLERAGVALSAGQEFGAAHGQWVRLNFGCTRARLEEGIAKIVASLATLPG